MNLVNIAENILTRCPRCSGEYRGFEVKNAQVHWKGFGNKRPVLRVGYDCDCMDAFMSHSYDIESDTVEAYLAMKENKQRKLRELFGFE